MLTIRPDESLNDGDTVNITLCMATMRDGDGAYGLPGSSESFLKTSRGHDIGQSVRDNRSGNIGVVASYQASYEESKAPLLAYVHDDVDCFEEGWDLRVLREFEDPQVAIVGFGGALGFGLQEIYKTPYRIEQLQRIHYVSNQRDWEVHGAHETGARDVAVVDGFAMAVRREFLDQIGGWKWMKTEFHCYDTALCLMARRKGWKVRMVGIDCLHRGGGTSTKAEYVDWLKAKGRTPEQDHAEPHLWLYEEFRDVIPFRIPA